MNVARFNLSHGSKDEHRRYIADVRRLSAEMGQPVALLIDLPGPKYRSGPLAAGAEIIKKGDSLVLTTRRVAGSAAEVSVNLPTFPGDVRAGALILVDDGAMQLKAEKVKGQDVLTRVLVGGKLTPGRGIALPDGRGSSPYIPPPPN
jgi:pyruvate kinase